MFAHLSQLTLKSVGSEVSLRSTGLGLPYMLTLSDTWYLRHLPRTTIMKEGGQIFGGPMADPAFSTDFVEPQANLQSRPTKQTVAQLV